jgi:hypothetical protein
VFDRSFSLVQARPEIQLFPHGVPDKVIQTADGILHFPSALSALP